MWGENYFSIRGLEKFHSLHVLEYILLPLFRINLSHRQKSLPFLNRLSLGADVIMSKTALESIMAQNYKIPLAYIEYADGIYSLLTKMEMSNRDWLLIFVYLCIIGIHCQQVYRSLVLGY